MKGEHTDPLNVYHTRVRAHQTDLNAAMHHAAYLDVFDEARIETFRRLGYTYERLLASGHNVVIRRITCQYRWPARMDDLLTIEVSVPYMSIATMTINYRCSRGVDDLASAEALFAFVDAAGKPRRVPGDLRELVQANASTLQLSTKRP